MGKEIGSLNITPNGQQFKGNKMKKAICVRQVPSILSPTNNDIQVGEIINYKKVIFRNGEHHYVLTDKKQVPSIFFEDLN
jgi:hypothetical protein